ncbi:MAG: hypothetical protein ACLT8E_09415 [Akkermansia sp.]
MLVFRVWAVTRLPAEENFPYAEAEETRLRTADALGEPPRLSMQSSGEKGLSGSVSSSSPPLSPLGHGLLELLLGELLLPLLEPPHGSSSPSSLLSTGSVSASGGT